MTRATDIHFQGRAFDLLRLAPVPASGLEAQKAGPAAFDPRADAEEAFETILRHCLAHLAANVPVAEARRVEGVHQLRVGLRRLRAALTAFGADFRSPAVDDIAERAKSIAKALSYTRELDVFASDILSVVEKADPRADGLTALRLALDGERERSWNETVALLLSDRFTRFLTDLAIMIDRALWREGTEKYERLTRPARKLARKSLSKHLRKAEKRARKLETLDVSERHRLRIALKKLRYSAEFFAPLFNADDVTRFLTRLTKLQDVFGALNDVASAHDVLDTLVARAKPDLQSSLRDGAGFVMGWHQNRAQRAWTHAKLRWKRFHGVTPFWA